jgi:hypothetical protein
MAVRMFNTFNVSEVTFSEVRKNKQGGKVVYLNSSSGQKLLFQLPKMRAPFGLSEYHDEKSGSTTYSLPLSLEDPAILKSFQDLDSAVLDFITKNSEEILGKKMSREVIAEGIYKSPVKPSSKEGYSPTLNLKVLVNYKDGSIGTEAYSASRQAVPLTDLEKGQFLNAIVEINQIWRTPAGVGVSIRVHQVMFAAANKLKPCAFLAVDDSPEVEAESEPEDSSDISVDGE